MRCSQRAFQKCLFLSAGIVGVCASAPEATSGGFAIREQSVYFQGMSFAGAAAGDGLSAVYWNPAAIANFDGINTSSSYSLIIPEARVTVDQATATGPFAGLSQPAVDAAGNKSGDIAKEALVSASYGNYQLSPTVYVGMGLNAPFGLSTEPENPTYQGSVLARSTKLFTLNGNPVVGIKVAPGVIIGAGAQIQYADGTLRIATGVPGAVSTSFEGDDFAFGGTAGILLQPSSSTSIGLGWRSQLTHELEGRFFTPGASNIRAEAEIKLPDIVTLSLRQKLGNGLSVSGTVEWANWSRFEELRVTAKQAGVTALSPIPVAAGDTIAVIEADWHDSWFFSAGAEYEYSPKVTLRGGIAYELSPIENPEERIISIPDSDRVWFSLGGSYKYSETWTFDVAGTYIWRDDGDFRRTSVGGISETGTVEADTFIISVGSNTKW